MLIRTPQELRLQHCDIWLMHVRVIRKRPRIGLVVRDSPARQPLGSLFVFLSRSDEAGALQDLPLAILGQCYLFLLSLAA